MNRQRLALFLVSVISFQLNAQQLEPAAFDRYTTANGLSDNYVTSVVQDSTGYLWIGTAWGLNRFNGFRFAQFHPNNDSLSLPAEEVAGLTWLDGQRLAATGTGVHILDTRTMQTRNIFIPYHNKKYQFKFNMVMRVKGDEGGNLYVLTRSGFYHYDKNYTLVSRFDYYAEEEVPVYHFFFGSELFELDAQRLLIVSADGLYIYNKKGRRLQKMAPADAPLLAEFLHDPRDHFQLFQIRMGEFFVVKSKSDSLVYINLKEARKVVSLLPLRPADSEIGWRSKLFRVNDTLFYISAQAAGLYKLRFYPGSGKVVWSAKKELEAFLCTAFAKDANGHLLIATSKGLLRQKAEHAVVQTATLPPEWEEKFPSITVADVFASANKVYAGSRAGLLVFDKKTLRFERNLLFGKGNKAGNDVRNVAAIDANTLLVGTLGPLSLLQLNNHTQHTIVPPQWSVANDWTNDLHRDSKANIWISSHNIYRYNTVTGNFTTVPLLPQLLDVPAVIEEDRQGNIWMARHGLARYNTSLNKYDLYIDSLPYIRMPDKQVNALAIDAQNRVWFNSNNNGLMTYDVAKKTFRQFTRKDGLPDNNVTALAVIGHKVWIACYSGLACIDTRNFSITAFRKEDGFPATPVRPGARFFYDSSEHQLYIGFSDAVVRFNPDDVLHKGSPPQTFVEMVVVNGEKRIFFPTQPITTSWKEAEFNINIGSINFRDGSIQHYAYRVMEDESSQWIHTGSQPTFSISALSPGTHRIQVKTFSIDNRWPEQVKEITITVLPPFWRSTPFLIGVGVLFITLLYYFIKWRISLARRKEMVKTQIQKLKADDYKAQFELEQISHYFSSSLADKKTEGEVLWDVAQNLIGRMNYEDCVIYGWNDDRTRMIQKAAYGPKGKPELISASAFDVVPGQGIVGHVINTKQPVLVRDT
ncbi:MAG TPA: two-component regulator propeller domain-containing protein, partial [Flavisolibacter sp.]|nr:two-component regulator propeller domain-containing protein [Flavisolibacter sp.]